MCVAVEYLAAKPRMIETLGDFRATFPNAELFRYETDRPDPFNDGSCLCQIDIERVLQTAGIVFERSDCGDYIVIPQTATSEHTAAS